MLLVCLDYLVRKNTILSKKYLTNFINVWLTAQVRVDFNRFENYYWNFRLSHKKVHFNLFINRRSIKQSKNLVTNKSLYQLVGQMPLCETIRERQASLSSHITLLACLQTSRITALSSMNPGSGHLFDHKRHKRHV